MTVTLRVLPHHLIDRRADGVGIRLGTAALERDDGAIRSDLFEHRRRVVSDRIVAGLLDAVALDREHVQQHRIGIVLDLLEPGPQAGQIVAIDRTDIMKAQLLEQHAAGEQRLESVADLVEGLVGHAPYHRDFADQPAQFTLRALVKVGEPGAVEALRQGADARTNGHLVVIEDDQELPFEMAGIVERLEDDAGRQGAVAHDGHAITIRVAHQLIARLEAERSGHRATGVAGHEEIERTLLRIGIAHEAAARANRIEAVEAARDEFVRINLMSRVPDQSILGKIESQVQCKAQFHHAKVAGEMRGSDAQDAHELVAHFLRQLLQFGVGKLVQVRGCGDPREEFTHETSLSAMIKIRRCPRSAWAASAQPLRGWKAFSLFPYL